MRRPQTILAVLLVLGVSGSLIACGVPKTEHEKVVQELKQANQEKTSLTEQVDKLTKEKESLAQQVTQLQKENEDLKAKVAAMSKPAKPAAKAPAKKK